MLRRLFFVIFIFIMAPTYHVAAAEEAPDRIPPDELFQLIHIGAPPPIVDVRSAAEYARGHLPGAIHIPFWRVYARTSQIGPYRNQPIVVYCEHGPRAAFSKAALRLSGFKKVLYLDGHMRAWREGGFPLTTEPSQPLSPGSSGR